MCQTSNEPSRVQDQTQTGCCCGSSSDAPKSAELETCDPAEVARDPAVKKAAHDQPVGCCGTRVPA